MRRRDFLGWLAALPFLRKLSHVKPEAPSLYEPLLTHADFNVEAVHPTSEVEHYVMCVGDTRVLWGNGAFSPDTVVYSELVNAEIARIAGPAILKAGE